VLDVLAQKGVEGDSLIEATTRDKVKGLLDRYPIYDM
jgi:glycine hydroxymethyltransferase